VTVACVMLRRAYDRNVTKGSAVESRPRVCATLEHRDNRAIVRG
jgi:hypothetical protein